MDHIERLELVERVQRASEQQAKRTLNSMILKCKVHEVTIARAIKDAVERHTPTPTIVYQDPASEDEDEPARTSPRKKSKKKRKDEDGGSRDEGDVPSTTSKKRRSTRRGEINPDPLVGKLILEKTKTKLKRNKKRSSNYDEERSSPDASKKSKSKHTSKPRAEIERRTYESSTGRPSIQKDPPVIDLVTSSEDETCDTQESDNENPDDKSSHDPSADNDCPDDSSSDSDISDDGGSEDEAQGDAFADGIGPSQDGSDQNTSGVIARHSDDERSAARSVTTSIAKASNQNDRSKTTPFVSGKKRKMPELTVGDVHNDQHANSTSIVHLNKRSKQNHPQVSQSSSEDRTCRKCTVLFPSLAQLLKHRVYCKCITTTFDSHHRSEPPSNNRPRPVSQVQKDSNPAGDIFTGEPHNTLQLPSRPRPRTPTDRGLSVPPPSFVHEPNNFPRGPTPTPLALACSSSGIQSSPLALVNHPVVKSTLHGSLHNQSRPADTESPRKRLLENLRDEAVRQCKFCKSWYSESENSKGLCRRHPGQYCSLTETQLNPTYFKDGIVPPRPVMGWTCCRRLDRNAPPCGRHSHVKTEGTH